MALYKDSHGQLVIAAAMPVGGAVVAGAASTSLHDMAAWFRLIDAGNDDWHPLNYYADGDESLLINSVSYSDITGAKPPVDATHGADSTNLKVGIGSNRIPNSEMIGTSDPNAFNTGWPGVTIGSVGLASVTWTGREWQPTGAEAIYVHQSNISNTGDTGICSDIYPFGGWWGDKDTGVPVQEGQKVEVTAYVAAHRCLTGLGIGFFNTAGGWVGGYGLDNQAVGTGGTNIASWTRLGLFGIAPPGSAYYHVYYRKNNTLTGFLNSYAWFSMPCSGVCHLGQTEFSPYVPSYTTSTKQLFDGAGLGNTAIWGMLNGRPVDADLLNSYKTWWNLDYRPGTLSELNAYEGGKLSGVQPGATNNSASAFANLVGKLSQSIILDYFENAAITNALIDSLDAAKINAGYLNAARLDANQVYIHTLQLAYDNVVSSLGGNLIGTPTITPTTPINTPVIYTAPISSLAERGHVQFFIMFDVQPNASGSYVIDVDFKYYHPTAGWIVMESKSIYIPPSPAMTAATPDRYHSVLMSFILQKNQFNETASLFFTADIGAAANAGNRILRNIKNNVIEYKR